MAGHSQYSNIVHRKTAQDAKKAAKFTKIVRAISVAVRKFGPDPETNSMLRTLLINARKENTPKDMIARAMNPKEINDNYDEIIYEGYGPEGVAILVAALTDNKNRSSSDFKSMFTKAGGSMAEVNSVKFLFEKLGRIRYSTKVINDEDFLLTLDPKDIEKNDTDYILYFELDNFSKSEDELEKKYGEAESSDIYWRPNNFVLPKKPDTVTKILKLIEQFEEHGDVQAIYHNLLI